MNNIKVQLLVEDEIFAEALSKALMRNNRKLDVVVFRERLLADRDVYVREVDSNLVVLGMGRKRQIQEKICSKYANVKQLVSAILMIYSEAHGLAVDYDVIDKCTKVAVLSSSGGAVTTVMALGMAEELSRFRAKKTLYISLKPCDTSAGHFTGMGDGAREYAYYVLTSDRIKEGGIALDPFICEDEFGVWAFNPGGCMNYLKDLKADEFEHVIYRAIAGGAFEAVIFDIGDSCDASAISAIAMSNRICVVKGVEDNIYLDWLAKRIEDFEEKEKIYVDPFDTSTGGHERSTIEIEKDIAELYKWHDNSFLMSKYGDIIEKATTDSYDS